MCLCVLLLSLPHCLHLGIHFLVLAIVRVRRRSIRPHRGSRQVLLVIPKPPPIAVVSSWTAQKPKDAINSMPGTCTRSLKAHRRRTSGPSLLSSMIRVPKTFRTWGGTQSKFQGPAIKYGAVGNRILHLMKLSPRVALIGLTFMLGLLRGLFGESECSGLVEVIDDRKADYRRPCK